LLLAVVAAAAVPLFVRPARSWHERVTTLRSALAREQAELEERPRLQSEILQLGAGLERERRLLPHESRLDEFVAEAGSQARRHRVRIVQLQPGAPRVDSLVAVLPVRMTVEGDFQRVYAWMIALETSPRLVRIESLQASRTSGSTAVRTEVQVGLYMGRGRRRVAPRVEG
jgi:Tfp pilus assembly protein PilO